MQNKFNKNISPWCFDDLLQGKNFLMNSILSRQNDWNKGRFFWILDILIVLKISSYEHTFKNNT